MHYTGTEQLEERQGYLSLASNPILKLPKKSRGVSQAKEEILLKKFFYTRCNMLGDVDKERGMASKTIRTWVLTERSTKKQRKRLAP